MGEWLKPTRIAKIVIDMWVKDLDETIKRLADDYGLGPWKLSELKAPLVYDLEFRGEPVDFDVLAAMTDVGPLAIEVLQIRGGSESVTKWFGEKFDGYWHPVAYHETVEQAEEAKKKFDEIGIEVILSGRVAGSRFFMLDTEGILGRMFEIAGGNLSDVPFEAAEA